MHIHMSVHMYAKYVLYLSRMHVCLQVLCIYECMYHITIVRRCSVTSSVALESKLESSATVKEQDYTHCYLTWVFFWNCCAAPAASNRAHGVAHNCVGLLTASYIHVEGLPERGKKQTLFACGGYLRPSRRCVGV